MYWSGQMSLYSIKICWHEPWRGKFCVAVKAMVHATMKVHLLVIRTGSKTRTQINWFLSTNQPRIIYVIGLKCYFEIKSPYVCICMRLSSTIEQFWLGLSVSSLIASKPPTILTFFPCENSFSFGGRFKLTLVVIVVTRAIM